MLRDVSGRDLSITLFEKEHALPLIIGPTGPAGFVWYRGETELARAAAKANIPFTVASTSNTPMEDIYKMAAALSGTNSMCGKTSMLPLVTVNRALDAGYEALVLIIGLTGLQQREIDVRNGLKFPHNRYPHGAGCYASPPVALWHLGQILFCRGPVTSLFKYSYSRRAKGPR